MIILLLIIAVLLFLYAVLLIFYWRSWKAIPIFSAKGKVASIKISVIIAARNEEKNITDLLHSLQQQTYPSELFEIILVDDHSTDATVRVARLYDNVRILSLEGGDSINSHKKKAIGLGISAATGDLIVTTDADCVPPPAWLETIAAFKQETNAVFIAAPVSFFCDASLLQTFQAMDFMVLQGITGAAVFRRHLAMSNGANLAYERKVFYEVNGFKDIDHIASGDDMLLMHKIATKYPARIHYLKSTAAIVPTSPMITWKAFLNQRIRWASKATQYNDRRIFPVLLLVYLVNLSFPVLLIAGCWNVHFLLYSIFFLLIKTIVELPLFANLAGFFNKHWMIRLFPLFQPLHICYTLISGFLGQFGSYEWKGRKVK
ncbi:MAG: glycosyl transferase [Citrobacter freundii]|nr:MAG: glycosyl transferase [Citrobacter freundii]